MAVKSDPFLSVLWLLFAGRDFLAGRSIELLRQIDKYGSLSKAVHEVPISYKAAWDLIDKLNNLSDKPLVETSTGGRFGGGTVLTEFARSILRLYDSLEKSYHNAVNTNTMEEMADTSIYSGFFQRLCMKTSARNNLAGTITGIIKGTINSEVSIRIAESVIIKSTITNDSVADLTLEEGKDVIVLVKASSVIVFEAGVQPRSSIQNCLKGKVVEVRLGIVNVEVLIEIPGGKIITAVITREGAENLGLSAGCEAVAAFSASNVILALPL